MHAYMCIYAHIYVHICADAYMKGSNFIYVAYMLNIYVSIYVTYIFFPCGISKSAANNVG